MGKKFSKSLLDFNQFQKRYFQDFLDNKTNEVKKSWENSKRVISFFADANEGILRNNLFFDDLRFFPISLSRLGLI